MIAHILGYGQFFNGLRIKIKSHRMNQLENIETNPIKTTKKFLYFLIFFNFSLLLYIISNIDY